MHASLLPRFLVATCLCACACAASPSPATATPAADLAPTPAASAEGNGPRSDAPRYRPSSSSPAPIPITSDAYGAYAAAESAPHLHDTLADFQLPLADGGTFSLAQARAAGPVVVMFYRGFW